MNHHLLTLRHRAKTFAPPPTLTAEQRKIIGRNLKAIRNSRKVSVTYVAIESGISHAYYERIENGESVTNDITIDKILSVLMTSREEALRI